MIFFLVIKLQICDSEHDHGLKDEPIYGINTNEKNEIFVDKYSSYDVLLYQL
jgi:hypothetical protein